MKVKVKHPNNAIAIVTQCLAEPRGYFKTHESSFKDMKGRVFLLGRGRAGITRDARSVKETAARSLSPRLTNIAKR